MLFRNILEVVVSRILSFIFLIVGYRYNPFKDPLDGVPYLHDFFEILNLHGVPYLLDQISGIRWGPLFSLLSESQFFMFLHCKALQKCDFFSARFARQWGPLFSYFFGKSEFLWGPLLTPPNLAEFGMGSLIEGGVFIYNTAVLEIKTVDHQQLSIVFELRS